MTLLLDDTQPVDLVVAPEAPATLADAGLPREAVLSLVLKWLDRGDASGTELAEAIRLPFGILEPIVDHLRVERMLEVKGAAGIGTAGYRYALSNGGRERAARAFEACAYVGPAPVPLDQYAALMAALSANRPHVDRQRVADGFSHLVVEPAMLDQLGPAVSAGRAVFLYGPPGNGKSVMGDGIGRVLGGDIFVPHALYVDGQIITIFDPVTHQPRERDADQGLFRLDGAVDGRWARIRRPVITVGGELTLDMLELRFNAVSGYYDAPFQLKANGGVLVVDDFGRQRVSPRDLLNRWVVPLESRVDYLGLHTGRKFQVPFDVMVVFATNLEPATLVDEAFLRRIPYKILAKNPTPSQFERIFELHCRRHGLAFDPAHVEHLQERYYAGGSIPMRACHPRDLIDQVAALCRYLDRPPAITTELLDTVCGTYFVEQ